TTQGEQLGVPHGKPNPKSTVLTAKAKKGYAIGALSARTAYLIEGLQVTYMKIGRRGLIKEDAYDSPVIGGKFGTERKLSNDGGLIGGVHGLDNENGSLGGIGVMLYTPKDTR